ncbi:MAG: hypothetical protein COX62_04305 [Deltaproteobacteria bacterium CG_4_10_14_0_2_um_filter_43_8]|nr:MAG: hypothetical protein COV43_06815 [Deltaproteobacteria bacterium CG11_big_fil_rev_8_21_14_0_20_42_23]PJA20617.1 MAG: hypothetical protein COX62_04305 [Deltaproteobacteria bacterium CG_4_10_14_0_2_um_filter_43_8]PJC65227.1 MAG: hypothetical protein CO021_00120 [Deltaproteobacteria bacterium CG_4_9_14_0_2_um_filter_42_21]
MTEHFLLFAHRGAKDVAPENTLSAFRKAIQLQADGVEFDVLVTKDGVPVVSHNNNLSELTNGRCCVHSSSYKEIEHLDAGSHFSAHYKGERLPTLVQVLHLFSGKNLLINIEIKREANISKKHLDAIFDIITHFGEEKNVIISSFSLRIMMYVKKRIPHIKRAVLFRSGPFSTFRAKLRCRIIKPFSLHPPFSALSRRLVRFAKMKGIFIYSWTINTEADIKKCKAMHIDGIMTDSISLSREFLKSH